MSGAALRERIVELRLLGHGQQVIADALGISQAYVSQLLSGERYRRSRLTRREKARRTAGLRTYECGVCGERGHNAGRHRSAKV